MEEFQVPGSNKLGFPGSPHPLERGLGAGGGGGGATPSLKP